MTKILSLETLAFDVVVPITEKVIFAPQYNARERVAYANLKLLQDFFVVQSFMATYSTDE